ncbi:MAG: hypothetical protein JSW33_05360 [bacterium]|nr:MAG: hypothetical protein JSW33_05360 [bacterium]
MKIIDVLLLEQAQGLFEKFAQGIAVQKVEDSRVQVYRLEIDPQLIILFYVGEINNKMPAYLVENIGPGLKRIIWLLDDQQFSDMKAVEEYGSMVGQFDELIPAAVVLKTDHSKWGKMAENLVNEGLFLGNHSRLYFWNQDIERDALRIWKSIWSPSDIPAGLNSPDSV